MSPKLSPISFDAPEELLRRDQGAVLNSNQREVIFCKSASIMLPASILNSNYCPKFITLKKSESNE